MLALCLVFIVKNKIISRYVKLFFLLSPIFGSATVILGTKLR